MQKKKNKTKNKNKTKKQYDNISILLKKKWNFVDFYPKMKFWWESGGEAPGS